MTFVQFNSEDDRYFISGFIDGKVRIWGLSNHRVIDWYDVKEAVTAACYQHDGQVSTKLFLHISGMVYPKSVNQRWCAHFISH